MNVVPPTHDARRAEVMPAPAHSLESDEAYQEQALPGVSRTFALTIPELPCELRRVVTNAYLLCRIADTIEDDGELSADAKQRFHEELVAVVGGQGDAERFSRTVHPLLCARSSQAERELVRNTARVIRVTHSFNVAQRRALERCVRIMCAGMPGYQRNKSLAGLASLEDLDQYCYYVAGVVGEMLTELFCDYSPEINRHREPLLRHAVRFGQGLQMTNILKDVWEDRRTDTCWLPRDVFEDAGFQLSELVPGRYVDAFGTGMRQLIGVAHAHLRHALQYTLLIPRRETGVRRFCLWAIGLAVLTLRKLYNNPRFTASQDVKVSRRTVRATVLTSSLAARSNRTLNLLFELAAHGLPLAAPERDAYGRETRAA
jgi:farnesyl-diphosphate farnesyltransferase